MFNYLLALTFFVVCEGTQWPVPYEPIDRPEIDPECKPLSRDFCKDGLPYGNFPIWWSDDTISLYALMQTKEELGDTVMGDIMISYTLGLRSKNTGKNYTLSWEPLSKLNDTIAPRILQGGRVVWCNQAAACLREDRHHFKQYTPLDIGSVSGEFIDAFEVWVKHVNNTTPFQQEFLFYDDNQVFLLSFDSTTFFIRAIKMLKSIGAKFSMNYLDMEVYTVAGHSPNRLGTEKHIRENHPLRWRDIMKFYGYLQAVRNFKDLVQKIFNFENEILTHRNFYYFFNGAYWHVKVRPPFQTVFDFFFRLP